MSPLARGSISPAGFGHDSKVYAASRVKERTQLPVICVSNIFTGEEAESILAKGLVDMVAVGRGHLADPAWAGTGWRKAGCVQALHNVQMVPGRQALSGKDGDSCCFLTR